MRLTLEGFKQRWGDHANCPNWIDVDDETIAARAELCTTVA